MDSVVSGAAASVALPFPPRSARRQPAATLASVPRRDLYRNVHAGLRACMCDALTGVARTDADDDADVAALAVRLREMVMLFDSHLANEDAFVHPAMEARRPGSTSRTAHDHAEHIEGFARLTRGVDALCAAPRVARGGILGELQRDLAAFVADNLVHMAAEERDNNAVLWATHTDAELAGIERSIVASIPPSKIPVSLRWMVPALPPAERLELMKRLRAMAPPVLFDAVIASIEPRLSDREWMKLADRLAAAV
jgi:Hemerythrin HHE cation binding domain